MNSDYLVLGLHPFSRGFGWILFEGPFAAHDWGVVERKKDRNARCLAAVERIVKRYRPAVIALETYDRASAPRIARIRLLCRGIAVLAKGCDVEVYIYPLRDIRATFASAGAVSRHEIASAIAERVASIRARLPKQRAIWESEKRDMALFNAAAVAITHYALANENRQP